MAEWKPRAIKITARMLYRVVQALAVIWIGGCVYAIYLNWKDVVWGILKIVILVSGVLAIVVVAGLLTWAILSLYSWASTHRRAGVRDA